MEGGAPEKPLADRKPHLERAGFQQARSVVRHRIRTPLRLGGEQALGIFVFGPGEDLVHRPRFDDAAGKHHADPRGDALHDAEIVGDEQHRHAEALLQVGEESEDLRLDGDVEGGRRLVRHQQIRLASERHGDHDALALAAGQFVRIGAHAPLGVADADEFEQFEDAGAGLAAGQAAMDLQNLADLPLDRVQRIERGHRLLEHHGDVGTTDLAQFRLRQDQNVPPLEQDATAGMDGAAIEETQDRQGRHRLARPGLAHQGHRLAPVDREAHAIHCQRLTLTRAKGDRQVLDVEQRVSHRGKGTGSADWGSRGSYSAAR